MTDRIRAHAGKLLAALLLTATLALAGINLEGQAELTTLPATFSVVDGAEDSESTTATTRALACNANPSLYLSPISATAQGATACVKVELYGPGDGYMGTAYVGTFYFDSHLVDGVYKCKDVRISTSCSTATKVDVQVIAVSAGTVSFKRWVGAAESQ